MKEIWSKRYGKNPHEGIHKFLENKVAGYKRKNVHVYLKGFAEYIGKDKPDSQLLASSNFKKWVEFLKLKKFF